MKEHEAVIIILDFALHARNLLVYPFASPVYVSRQHLILLMLHFIYLFTWLWSVMPIAKFSKAPIHIRNMQWIVFSSARKQSWYFKYKWVNKIDIYLWTLIHSYSLQRWFISIGCNWHQTYAIKNIVTKRPNIV